MKKVLSSNPYDVPQNDLYGRLYFYIVDKMKQFVALAKTGRIHFHLFNQDAKDLLPTLKSTSFDRIDVSNISDENYLGIKTCLKLSRPLLNRTNPCSKLITTFMNWVAGTEFACLHN